MLSYGGDALLLGFDGEHHAGRAVRAAIGMRAALRAHGPIHTDAGRVRLRISQGVHTGRFQIVVAGSAQRELMLIGSAATTVTDIEGAAGPGDVLMSTTTAELLPARCVGRAKAGHVLARSLPPPTVAPQQRPITVADDELEAFLPPAVRERIQSGGLDPEHRFVGVAFVQVLGVDAALAERGAEQTAADLSAIVDATERAAAEHGTCLLASDIAPDGVKLIVTAGAPSAAEDGEGTLLTTIRTVLDHDFALPVRAGAHAGHVFAGEVGAPDRRVYTVIGDTVNLAARLMGKADPGQLVASAGMLASAGARFEHQPLEPFFVKGKRHAQHASIIGGRIDDGSQVGWEDAPFVGRAAEFAVLEQARAAARSGRGSVVDIVGGPGVGKSRLLHRFLDDTTGWRVIRVSSEPYQSSRPFYATRLVLRSVLDVDQQADPAEAGRALLRRLQALDPEMMAFAPLLAQAIDADVPTTPEVDDLAPAFRMQRLQELVGRVMALALVDPTILVFEDANFVDGSSRDVFEFALKFIHAGPWLAVLTRRDTDSGLHDGLEFPRYRLELEPLVGADLLALAHQICERRPIPGHQLDELVDRADGNPLFLIELVQARLESGARGELPSTLEGIIAARIDRLATDDRRLLRHLAVLGDRFPPDLARSVLADLVPQITDPRSLHRLAEFIIPDQDDLRFSHGLLREVAYEGLPFARRRLVHRRFAETLEIQPGQVDSMRLSLLALHFDLAGMHRHAYRYCRRAGERASHDGANVEAAALLERAIRNARRCGDIPPEQLAAVAEMLADVAELAARYDTAAAALRLARSVSSADSAALARLSRKEGVVRERTGHFDAALRWYRTGRKHAEQLDEPLASAQRGDLMLATAGVAMHQGKLRVCIRWAQRALEQAIAAGNRRAEAHAYYLLDLAHTDLGDSEAAQYRGRSLAIFEEIGDLAGLARTLGNLAVDARYEGRWDDALELAGRCSEALQRLGDVTGLAVSQYNAAEVLQDQGRLADAEEMLVNARRTWRAAGFTLGVGAATGALGRVAVRSGDDERAIALIDEAITMLGELGADTWAAELSAHRIEADLFAGRWADVIEAVPVGRQDRASGQDAALRSKLLRFRGVAEAALDEPDAVQTLERAVWYAREADSAYEEALARLELAELGDVATADEHWSLAEQTLRTLGVIHPEVLIPHTPQRGGVSISAG